ncbi:hypothetical protein Q7C36_005489 [Tachysurus vachellii]|uniref:Uncharacterized protein n=1 Tax=Tachysurus vachellii TaxID=175792 RepID=A0AA88NJ36_TACVA|nr:hypothetical protein Q7C36_005489 [Tachysurus vachellii]
MCTEMEQQEPQTPKTRVKIALLKGGDDMFRHRTESNPYKRPNMKTKTDSGLRKKTSAHLNGNVKVY